MVDSLTEYLRESASLKFDRSKLNCGLWVADWIERRTGIDPGKTWRGLDLDIDRFELLKNCEDVMINFATTKNPVRGDVGIILTSAGPTSAIFGGRRWFVLSRVGICSAAWPMIKGWSLNAAGC